MKYVHAYTFLVCVNDHMNAWFFSEGNGFKLKKYKIEYN